MSVMPRVLALDFDGVICDGLIEYFSTTKEAYNQIWSNEELIVNDDLAHNFYQLRPVIETGWEMPVLLRALVLKSAPEQILNTWHSVRDKIVEKEQLDRKYCAQTLDLVRDRWIKNDLENWLKLHRFYPGVLDKIKQIIASNIEFYIVTTKEGRFVKQLLEQQGIALPANHIIGKESQRPKYETLRIIRDRITDSDISIWFVEDRIQALKQVQQQSDLKAVKLFLADWGYNTEPERAMAKSDRNITLLSLSQFAQNFPLWLS